ncbi:MAG: hypothetical protein KA201_39385 [Kofleriaceae bacterium]|nr:hypothetical protein [Kofleriaceae bacterium]
MASDRSDVLGCVDCGAMCTWDPADRDTHPDAARRPVAGWVERGPGSWFLEAGDYLLQVSIDYNGAPRWTVWLVTSEAWISRRADNAATVEAAQLACEDALRAIAAEILRAVGS